MAHLADKLADFFYEELPSAEMSEARRHLETCKVCRFEVEKFERIHLTLRTVPELDPPRRVVFAPPERRSWLSWFEWRSAAAASAFAALLAGRAIGFSHLDYNRIVSEVDQADSAWLAVALNNPDEQVQRLRR